MNSILLIDDNPAASRAMRRVLERAGYNVTTAGEGNQGVRLDRQIRPDLVIVDMLMPGKEGAATIIEIREARPDARILAISGGGSFVASDVLRIAELLGADGAIQKPFATAALLEAVERCLVSIPPTAGVNAPAARPIRR